MNKGLNRYLCLGVLAFVAVACSAAAGAEQGKVNRTVMKAGDLLEIRIPVSPMLSKQYTIAENGKLYFPVLDDVNLGWFTVAGPEKECTCTVSELEGMIRARLDEIFQPELTEVTIDVVSLTMRIDYSVNIMGEILAPGAIKYSDGMRLVDVLVKAGRFTEKADLSSVRISRAGKLLPPVDIRGLMNGTDFSSNILLETGDLIIVPEKADDRLTVMALGRVKNIGKFKMPPGSKVLDLFAEIQGDEGRSGIARAYIIRTVNNKATALSVDLKALTRKLDMTQNRELEDGDVFYVPESKGFDVMRVVNNITVLNFFKNMVKVDY